MAFTELKGQSVLEIRNVSHWYGQKLALQDVAFSVKHSEVLALLGPSGSGKSTLLAVIAGIVRPSQGEVSLGGRNLLALPPRSRGIGMVFQDFALWPHMSVAQNVAFPLRARRYTPTEIAIRTEKALTRVGLEELRSRRPHELSGGQQQRVALARAVVADTQLLLLDEPLSALDPATRSNVRSELADILRRLKLTTIIVTHDREEAFELADKVAVLADGKLLQLAPPEEVYERPANQIVARFMGANVISAYVCSDGSAEIHGDGLKLELAGRIAAGPAQLAIVPEQVRTTENKSALNNVLRAQLLKSQYRGGEYRLQVRIAGSTGQIVEARSKIAPVGDSVSIHLPVDAIHVIQEPPQVVPVAATCRRVTSAHTTNLKEENA